MYAQTTARTFATDTLPNAKTDWIGDMANGQRAISLRNSESLFFDGDDADFVYEVLEGLIMSYSILPDGRRQIISFAYPGDIFGLSHDGTHHYCCCAKGAARVRSMPRKMLMRIAQDRPEITAKLLNCASKQLNQVQDHFVLLGRKCAQEKVASFILILARRYAKENATSVTFTLPMTRSDIADYLGTTIETVSRQLSSLRKTGVIDLPQISVVHVRDMFELEELAERDDDTF